MFSRTVVQSHLARFREHLPVQVGRHDERQLMPIAQVQLVLVLHNHLVERLVHEVLEELQADFGSNHGRIRRQILKRKEKRQTEGGVNVSWGDFRSRKTSGSAVVRLGMCDGDVGDGARVDLLPTNLHAYLPTCLSTSEPTTDLPTC